MTRCVDKNEAHRTYASRAVAATRSREPGPPVITVLGAVSTSAAGSASQSPRRAERAAPPQAQPGIRPSPLK